jgi:hypothetical protein
MIDHFLEADAEAQRLRHLVDRRDFMGAQRSVERYVNLIDAAIPLTDVGEASRRVKEACDLIDWARRNLRAAQARLSDEMRGVQRVARYQSGAATGYSVHLNL